MLPGMSDDQPLNGRPSPLLARVQSLAPVIGLLVGGLTFGYSTLNRIATLESTQAVRGPRLAAMDDQIAGLAKRMGETEAAVAGLTTRLAALEARADEARTESGRQADRVAALRTDVTQIQSALTEIETQFCGSDHLRNLMHANELRVEAMLWSRVFGSPLPVDNAYYPTVCNRPGR